MSNPDLTATTEMPAFSMAEMVFGASEPEEFEMYEDDLETFELNQLAQDNEAGDDLDAEDSDDIED